MVLTECLKLRVKLMNAILVSLPCQLLHLIGKPLTLDLLKSLLGGSLLVITAARDGRRTPVTSRRGILVRLSLILVDTFSCLSRPCPTTTSAQAVPLNSKGSSRVV